jgi:putative methyltransferase (TIGR04325 family)
VTCRRTTGLLSSDTSMNLPQTIKSLATALLPPVVADSLRRRLGDPITWSGEYLSWDEAVAASGRYDDASILERVANAALRVKRGEVAYERDGVLFAEIEYSWPLLAGLMWIAARSAGGLDVLDFGGSLGSTYFQNRRFLSQLGHVQWSIVEQPHFVARGRREFEDETLRFYESIEACQIERAPNVVVVSSVLPYLEHPYDLLDTLRGRFRYVLIDLTGVHAGERDRLTVQHVPERIYSARYPCWLFSEARLVDALQRNGTLVAAFDSHIGQDLRAGNLRFRYRGFILEAGGPG